MGAKNCNFPAENLFPKLVYKCPRNSLIRVCKWRHDLCQFSEHICINFNHSYIKFQNKTSHRNVFDILNFFNHFSKTFPFFPVDPTDSSRFGFFLGCVPPQSLALSIRLSACPSFCPFVAKDNILLFGFPCPPKLLDVDCYQFKYFWLANLQYFLFPPCCYFSR